MLERMRGCGWSQLSGRCQHHRVSYSQAAHLGKKAWAHCSSASSSFKIDDKPWWNILLNLLEIVSCTECCMENVQKFGHRNRQRGSYDWRRVSCWITLSRSSTFLSNTLSVAKDRSTQNCKIFSANLPKDFEHLKIFDDVEVLSNDFTLGGI